LAPIPNPQSPIPNPQSPIPIIIKYDFKNDIKYNKNNLYKENKVIFIIKDFIKIKKT